VSVQPCILFTAFEPSGDAHAAAVIAQLRRLRPDIPIAALGGPAMARAGASLIERTTDHSAMLGGVMAKVREQWTLRRRVRRWLDEHPLAVHVPTDSPAANWWFCRTVKQRWPGAKVVHFIAPQVWAWAPWRVRRLRKWSDLVLCVLPFEPQWFARHGVEARFIGHPLLDDATPPSCLLTGPAAGSPPMLALLPGSRPGEISAHWPIMLEVWRGLRQHIPHLQAQVAAIDSAAAEQIRAMTPPATAALPEILTGQVDAILDRADVVLTVSGTATLHVARARRPMVVIYRVPPLQWHVIGRWLLRTRTFTLPNLIAAGGPGMSGDEHIVREFVPFTRGPGAVDEIVHELQSLLTDPSRRDRQLAALDAVLAQFRGHHAGREAARLIADMAGG
jgi:lipid-A-disaccharide synthase